MKQLPFKATCAVTLATLGALSGLAHPSAAEEPDATAIMRDAHIRFYYAGDDGVADVVMTLTDKKGRERLREFTMLRWDEEDGGEQRYYTYFKKPADVRRTTFMVIKHQGADDDRWIYVPAVDLVRRVSARDKNSSFVGSDFSYEDVSGRHWLDDEHLLESASELDGTAVYVIRSTPTDGAAWAYRLSYIDVDRLLPLKEEYFDEDGEMIRIFTADQIDEVDGIPTVTARTMRDLKKERQTTVVFSDVKYNTGIDPDIFSERYLKAPPREYVQ